MGGGIKMPTYEFDQQTNNPGIKCMYQPNAKAGRQHNGQVAPSDNSACGTFAGVDGFRGYYPGDEGGPKDGKFARDAIHGLVGKPTTEQYDGTVLADKFKPIAGRPKGL
jgi:hypothetical protein